jgi:hypothetical protein
MGAHMPRRRDVLKYAAAGLTLLVTRVGAGATAMASVLAVRVWPARDYTRVTLENDQAIRYTQMLVKNPERLVVDLEGVEFNQVLQTLPTRSSEADPYIKLIRAGRNKPGVVRLVIELKGEVKPQVFALKPVGEYGHRLVFDLLSGRAGRPADGPAGEVPNCRTQGQLKAESKLRGEPDRPAASHQPAHESEAEKPIPGQMSRAWSPSCSIPDMAARTPVPLAAAAATRRT